MNTLDDVFYELGDLLVGKDEHRALVAMTVAKLPEPVQEYVFENVQFIVIEQPTTMRGLFVELPPRDGDCENWKIIVCSFPEDYGVENRMDTIAHEIAHVFAGHKQWHQGAESNWKDNEIEAKGMGVFPCLRLDITKNAPAYAGAKN